MPMSAMTDVSAGCAQETRGEPAAKVDVARGEVPDGE